MTQYRLLRNNKETGPYTKEQLVEMGLKAYDLIWSDGKSAAWRYPSEIEELKAFAPIVEENPFDRFYKRKETKVVPEKEAETVAAETPAIKKEKPRFRVKADVRKVDTVIPAYESNVATVKEPQNSPIEVTSNIPLVETPKASVPPPPAWEAIYSEWKTKSVVKEPAVLESVALPLNDSEPIIETKYSQSLSDIKERYVETILKPREVKKSGVKISRRYAALAILIPLLGFGMWWSYKFKEPQEGIEKIASSAPVSEVKQETNPSLPEDDNNENSLAGDASQSARLAEADNELNLSSAEEIVKNRTDVNSSSNETKPSAQVTSVVNKNIAGKNEKAGNEVVEPKNNAVTNQAVSTKPSKPLNTPVSTVNTNPAKDYEPEQTNTSEASDNTAKSKSPVRSSAKKSIEDYVIVNNTYKPHGTSIQNIRLSVENVTEIPIDLAVLDVEYFDAKGRYQKGETVYVKNIPANKNVLVKVPDSGNSYSINYKVSLISAEQSTLYLIAD